MFRRSLRYELHPSGHSARPASSGSSPFLIFILSHPGKVNPSWSYNWGAKFPDGLPDTIEYAP